MLTRSFFGTEMDPIDRAAASEKIEINPEDAWKILLEIFNEGLRPTVLECADCWQISMSAASRKIQGWEAKNQIRTERVGRSKRIVWINVPPKGGVKPNFFNAHQVLRHTSLGYCHSLMTTNPVVKILTKSQ